MNGISVKVYSKAVDGSTALSKNFRVREFACSDGADAVFVSPELVGLLQQLRDWAGASVQISSAYRTAAHNRKVGGATRSQHQYGTAADITVSGKTPLEVAAYAEKLLGNRGGIGLYRSFCHVDVRQKRCRWDCRSGKQTVVSGF